MTWTQACNYFLLILQNLIFHRFITPVFLWVDPSPSLVELRSWLHKPEGLAQILYGNLGNDTDELNQLLHTLYNVKKYPDMPHCVPITYWLILTLAQRQLFLQQVALL